MIYLDNGATTLRKPPCVARAMTQALERCANPGRGGYPQATEAARVVGLCRERAGALFDCLPEQVVFTANCTHGLNIAIRTLVKPGDRVILSGFEHNAVLRPLVALGAKLRIVGRELFAPQKLLVEFEEALSQGAEAAVFTHVSNVFGYVLPVAEMAQLCHCYRVPFVLDAAQSAGSLPVSLKGLGAAFIAMPGHKGLLGPQGTGLLLCGQLPKPLLYGGTGTLSKDPQMPDFLPERAEAGTLNVPGIAGLSAALGFLQRTGIDAFAGKEREQVRRCAAGLRSLGLEVFSGEAQSTALSFLPKEDCEVFAQRLGERGICVRAGLHCAPLAHESAGTLDTGTVRISYGMDASPEQTDKLLNTVDFLTGRM